jgi:hypothetical protein
MLAKVVADAKNSSWVASCSSTIADISVLPSSDLFEISHIFLDIF